MANKESRARQLRRQQQRQHQHALAAALVGSTPAKPALLGSLRSAEDDRESDPVRQRLRGVVGALAKARGHWAGCPMPLDGETLVIAKAFPEFAPLATAHARPEEDESEAGYTVRNEFRSTRWQGIVHVVQCPDGKVRKFLSPHGQGSKIAKVLTTLGCSDAWGLEQEERAMATLRGLTTQRQFRLYLLTGTFLERSKRSGVTYLFRRLRPTLALAQTADLTDTVCIAALCMHPIAHYGNSWAGAMCPTDDVIAHLMLMRGDEHMFWKRSNQHPSGEPQAGL